MLLTGLAPKQKGLRFMMYLPMLTKTGPLTTTSTKELLILLDSLLPLSSLADSQLKDSTLSDVEKALELLHEHSTTLQKLRHRISTAHYRQLRAQKEAYLRG